LFKILVFRQLRFQLFNFDVHVLEGTMTVEFEGGVQQTFQAGTGFLEVVNTLHSAKNLGEVPLKLLVVFVGEEGKPNLIRPERH
jgi:quercetin dioxygenase-like cupin family protein